MVEPDRSCYLVAYVGDVQQPSAAPSPPAGEWVLIAYVPSTCTSFEAKKMADNRANLKVGLGAEAFTAASMWCVSPEQITLSNYMRTLEESDGGEKRRDAAAREQEAAAAKIQALGRGKALRRGKSGSSKDADPGRGGGAGAALPDATEAVWEERIQGVRHAYANSCSRLVGALEDLEMTLCALTGDEYRQDEPLLHARAHMAQHIVR
mmetsp:Transcript_84601/g.168937  ORF Transcript_84601/g.168937 Transcript_84601/m.168937 type:complete len:208 (-) Transcript_84601:335-958(-)